GRSGSGKSTLSFLLSHTKSWSDTRCLSDDTFILDANEPAIHVYPVLSGFGLTSSILSRFHLPANEEQVVQRTTEKIYLKCVPRQLLEPRPVSGLIFLDKNAAYGTETRC